jgi:hypothetical protein
VNQPHTRLNAGDREPVIIESPGSIQVFTGSPFFLPCEINTQLIDTYQWMKDGVVLSSGSELTITPGVGIEVFNASKTHSGEYHCVVANGAGVANVSATVQVTNAVITCDGKFCSLANI